MKHLLFVAVIAACGGEELADTPDAAFESTTEDGLAANAFVVRAMYVVPSNRAENPLYTRKIAASLRSLQAFYRGRVGGGETFTIGSPAVVVRHSPHAIAWFQANNNFYGNVRDDAVAGGVKRNDAHVKWMVYVDGHEACGKSGAGTLDNISVMVENDLRGLAGQQALPVCPGNTEAQWSPCRWVGGQGHELAHAFTIPHPPECEQGLPSCSPSFLMHTGYAIYPASTLRSPEIAKLRSLPWFAPVTLPAAQPVCNALPPVANADYNGDSRADFSVFRPSEAKWYRQGLGAVPFGRAGDLPLPGHYTDQQTSNLAVYRPSEGTWYFDTGGSTRYGEAGDIPVPADYDGDGLLEIAVWRPATGEWFVHGHAAVVYGEQGDIPVPGDYNGDGKADFTVWRPSTGTWFFRGRTPQTYGQLGDIPVPADYNGDGRTDAAVWRPSTGTWFVRGVGTTPYGQTGDIPVPGDYTGDGKADRAVWRPSTGEWFVHGRAAVVYGIAGDIPLH